jgi:hypothetical protein
MVLGSWKSLGASRHGGWSAGHRERGRRHRAALAALGLESILPSRVVGASKATEHCKRIRHLAADRGLGRGQHRRPKADVDSFGGTEPAAGKGDPSPGRSPIWGEGAAGVGRNGQRGARSPGRSSR